MFRIGQKVRCVKPPRSRHWGGKNSATVGSVYTVRGLYDSYDNGIPGLVVYEITNPISVISGKEYGFYADRFVPVFDRETDISALKAILTKEKV